MIIKYIIILIFLPSILYAQGGIVVDGAYFNVDASTEVRVENAGVINQNGGQINNIGNYYQARVEDIVYDNGTTDNPETSDVVNRTWYIDEETIGGSDVTLTLQWDASQELTTFDRTQSAVTHWDGSQWDHRSI